MQATDTSAIHRLIGRARLRIRSQWAVEGATTASILAAASALATIFLMRIDWISGSAGIGLLIASGAIVVIGAILSAARRLDDETVARRIDRASGLADRLSTAIAFRAVMSGAPATTDEETADLMAAAIRDGLRAVPRANVAAAAPWTAPKDLRAAGGFLLISALAAGLIIPRPDRTPALYQADPDHGRPGEIVVLRGANLLTGMATPVASLPAHQVIGAPGTATRNAAAARNGAPDAGYVPTDATVYLGASEMAMPVLVLDWTHSSIRIRLPDNAPIGDTQLTAFIGKRAVGPVPFTVVDLKDARFHKETAVALDPDERAYVEAILNQLKAVAQRDKVPELDEFAAKIEQLLKDAEDGKITKEQLLDALSKAEDAMADKAEPNEAEINKAMAEMGKELAKEQVTKELGEALKNNDLEKAKEELEKLADKLDPKEMQDKIDQLKKQLENKDLSEKDKAELQKKLEQALKDKPLTEKQKEQLQQKLEQVAKQMDKQQQDQKQKQELAQQKLEEEIKRLQKQKEQAKNEQEKLSAERKLQKKQDELKRLQKDQDDKNQSAQREALKRLQKDVEKAAENLDKPKQDPNKTPEERDAEQQERDKQASRNLKDAARETGRVDQDQRKQAAQKKMSSQMDDLREAMRRAKQRGNKGPNDPFNKQGKNSDLAKRARGQKGSGQGWKPGQGQGKGQGQGQGQGKGNQPGGQGQQPGGSSWGVGHDDNLAGDPTGKSGATKDTDLQGTQGTKGTSRRETILAAAQKGFASVDYSKVFAEYQRIVEEVMRTEKLPSSYKYYVKRYFAKIHPNTGAPQPAPAPQDQP